MLSKEKPLNVSYDMKIQKHDYEGRIITTEYEKFILVTCYTPNAGQQLKRLEYRTKEWDPDFKNFINSLKTKNKKAVLLAGDLNCAHKKIDIARPEVHNRSAGFTIEERIEFGKLLDAGVADTFRYLHPNERKYSFWPLRGGGYDNSGWRLDYFLLTNEHIKSLLISDIMQDYYAGDHCPIKIHCDFNF